MHFLERLKLALRCIFIWYASPATHDELAAADCIIAQSFGLRTKGPGESNQALAVIVRELAQRYELPSLLQWEIADACESTVMPELTVREHRQPGEYLDTWEVLDQCREYCETFGWKRIVIVAHPAHAWRVMQQAKRLGFKVIVADTSQVPYDAGSTQRWTRSAWWWWPRELLGRLYLMWLGKM